MHKLIFYIGSFIRNRELLDKYKFLKETENWSIKKLEEYQYKELIKLLRFAYQESEFYRRKYDEAGVTLDNINTINDLSKLPTTDKKELINNCEKIQITKNMKKMFYSETSGSTGEPLVWYRDSTWDAATRAAQFRGYSWYDVSPWEKNGYFWGYSFEKKQKNKIKFLDFLLNRFRVFSYSDKEMEDFFKKLPTAKYVEGYSSMIFETAKKINANSKKNNYNLKMVKGTSEKIYDSYQPEILKAFGKKMISEYGAAESGLIAFECPFGNMHINMENVIVEEISGEIVVTNLVSKSFPVIRYKLGDSVKLDKHTKCKCGMEHYVIREVMGRVGKNIQGIQGIYPSLTLYYIFKNMAIKYNQKLIYQAIQKSPGRLQINLLESVSDDTEKKILDECIRYFRDDIQVIIIGNGIDRNYDEKFKDFISYID